MGAAYELTRNGVEDLALIDRNKNLGGLSRTEEFEGNLFDIGPHRFFTPNEEINRLWHSILGSDFLPIKRQTRIYHNKKYFLYPLEVSNALINLGLRKAVRTLLSFLSSCLKSRGTARTFEEWVIDKFGIRLYETFFKTYTEKVWGIPCNRIGAEWAAQRIKDLDLKALLKSTIWGNQKTPKTLVDEFDYPLRGAGSMYEAMWNKIAGDTSARNATIPGQRSDAASPNNAIHLYRQTKVTGIIRDEFNIVTVEAETEFGEKLRFIANHVFSSIPLTDCLDMLSPLAPQSVRAATEKLFFRDHITVNILIDGDRLFPDQWIYVHSPELKLARVANYSNFSPSMAARRQTTVLSAEYFVFMNDEIWNLTDSELETLASDELLHMGLIPKGRIIKSWVIKETESYPTYYLGFEEPYQTVKDFAVKFENLSFIGRGGMYKYNNMDHSLMTGILSARNYLGLPGAPFDVWAVNIDAQYQESAPRKA